MQHLSLKLSVMAFAIWGFTANAAAASDDADCAKVLAQPAPMEVDRAGKHAVAEFHAFANTWAGELKKLLVGCNGVGADRYCEYASDVKSMGLVREHAWRLFQELTALPNAGCPNIPYWLTWPTKRETYMPQPRTGGRLSVEQAQSLPTGSRAAIFGSAQYSPGLDVLLRNAKNKLVAGVEGKYWNAADQVTLGPPQYNKIFEIVVKPIWWTPDFHQLGQIQGTACLPVWPYEESSVPAGVTPYPPRNWPADPRNWVILTDGSILKPGGRGKCQPPDRSPILDVAVVSIDEIFHLAAESGAQQLYLSGVASQAQKGAVHSQGLPPVAVLAGIHVISHEIDSWTWNTFWWEPKPYRRGTDYSRDRLPLRGVWNNYVMKATLNRADDPVNGRPRNAIYNPYQETALPSTASQFNNLPLGGLASNCLSCHQNASYEYSSGIGLGVFTPGSQPQPNFDQRVRIGFLWSLAKFSDAFEIQ
jgi:hypothetical protein